MPYIPPKRRPAIDAGLNQARDTIQTPGDLTYAITKLCLDHLPDDAHFADYHSIMGVLGCVQAEFYRRHVVPYEDEAMVRNGDV